MKEVTVYRVDYLKKTRVPIGVVTERRERERKNNLLDLLRLARRRFARDVADFLSIAIDRGNPPTRFSSSGRR